MEDCVSAHKLKLIFSENGEFMKKSPENGFTLVEISIVLVIIGLIVGAILLGRDLISAAAIRSQISQIEKYQTAMNTFKIKYGCLPGDCKNADQFGMLPSGQYAGFGDGNGLIEGSVAWADNMNTGTAQGHGETATFWAELAMAGLIDGNFPNARNTALLGGGSHTESSTQPLSEFYPRAKIGNRNYVYIWSNQDEPAKNYGGLWNQYFGISAVYEQLGWAMSANPGLSVQQAYAIDSKVDDGLPLSGKVQPLYVNYALTNDSYCNAYSQGVGVIGPYTTTATTGSSTTCYDNGGVAGATQKYSLNQNGGNGINCALSFKIQ